MLSGARLLGLKEGSLKVVALTKTAEQYLKIPGVSAHVACLSLLEFGLRGSSLKLEMFKC